MGGDTLELVEVCVSWPKHHGYLKKYNIGAS